MQQEQNNLLITISNLLEQIVKETDQIPLEHATVFHSQKAPSIGIYNYFQRIAKYTNCSDQCFIIALIYLDKVQEQNERLVLNSLCIHRFIIVAMMIAIKYQDDDYYKNEYYAKVGGISLKEINQLEAEFLKLIEYQLYIDKSLFDVYQNKLLEYHDSEI